MIQNNNAIFRSRKFIGFWVSLFFLLGILIFCSQDKPFSASDLYKYYITRTEKNKTETSSVLLRKEMSNGTENKEGTSNVSKKGRLDIANKDNQPKIVLLYTNLFGARPWPWLVRNDQFTGSCEVTNCQITYDRKDLHKSDAVIFHGRDIGGEDLMRLSKSVARRATQRWVYFIHENAIYSGISDFGRFDNVFNLTMTFKLSSDIFAPYQSYMPLEKTNTEGSSESKNYADGKDSLVFWVVSHCGRPRDIFVKKLMQFIPVHVYGRCSQQFSQNRVCARGDKGCVEVLRKYKFVLAFENANCVDYITEKYWSNGLDNNVVPVVLGGGNYSDSNLAIPGSFINALDFPSVKSLAEYLLMLDKNDTAYNEYFAWKKVYRLGIAISWTCILCEMLNNSTAPSKSYSKDSFAEFYSVRTNCGFVDKIIERMVAS